LRARALGVRLAGEPGPWNALTDVPGVEVGYVTLIKGDAVRTGVTAILPRGRDGLADPCAAGSFSFNGNGEMTGTTWIAERGALDTPIALTNTHAVGPVHEGVIRWVLDHADSEAWLLPVVAETYDGDLNDINGGHVRAEHAVAALDAAVSGPVDEGSVGGGTGMICYGFKGGSGTASRRVTHGGDTYTVAAFVQANFGAHPELVVAGVPVGASIPDDREARPHPPANAGALTSMFPSASAGYETLRFVPWGRIDPFYAAAVQAVEESVLNALVANEDMTGRNGRRVPALPPCPPHQRHRAGPGPPVRAWLRPSAGYAGRPERKDVPMIVVTVSREYSAGSEAVLAALADYRDVRPRLLPPAFEDYAVVEGGTGAGTHITYRLRATKKRIRNIDADVTAPASTQLVETDRNSTLTTTWTVTPTGSGSSVTAEIRWEGSTGVGGFFERRFAPGGTRRIYDAVLDALTNVLAGADHA
jgi:D-aminopeptidase